MFEQESGEGQAAQPSECLWQPLVLGQFIVASRTLGWPLAFFFASAAASVVSRPIADFARQFLFY